MNWMKKGVLAVLVIMTGLAPISYAESDDFKIIHKRPVVTVTEKVIFEGVDENMFPDNYYDIERWDEQSALSFSTAIEDDLTLLSWYLVKKEDRFQVIPLADAMLSPEYKKVNGRHQYTIYAPRNINVYDSDGKEYTEDSSQLYGLIAYYFTPLGEDMPDKPVMRLVKFGPDAKIVDQEKDMVYELSSEYKKMQVEGYIPPQQPVTSEAFAQVFLYMGINDIYEYKVSLPHAKFNNAISSESKAIISEGFEIAKGKYPEYMSYYDRYQTLTSSAGLGSDVKITISNEDFSNEEITMMRTLFKIRAQGYVETLKQSGKLSDEMTDWDKAKAIYEWVILNTRYDETKKAVSQTGFGQMDNGEAVCEGYTATYNEMCRNVGIDVQGVPGQAGRTSKGPHIWTLADLDGTRVHIDTTWGDPVGEHLPKDYIDYDFFAQSAAGMRPHHEWKEDLFGK